MLGLVFEDMLDTVFVGVVVDTVAAKAGAGKVVLDVLEFVAEE